MTTNEYNQGDKVRILPEWQDGDTMNFVVTESDEGKGRVTIAPIEWNHGAITPTQVIATSMIERI